MIFSSVTFTFIFLPVIIFIYYISKNKYKNIILVIASVLFYAYGEHRAVLIMLFSIGFNYLSALAIDKVRKETYRKIFLVGAIACNLGILYIFKYLDFSITIFNGVSGRNVPLRNIALPIGISFFTFQAMSYVIDVYRHSAAAETNVLNVALYVSFFPQLVAGPIVRYNTIAQQIKDRYIDAEHFGYGAKRFICGFCKKIILANNLAVVAENALLNTDFHGQSIVLSWLGAICFTLQIYYDFSGYSDMAIGLGRMFGFQFEENFNYPYISGSVTEFWRRWHISLGQWFRDYVYIPLGGSRVSALKHIRNLLIVWSLTGLWHGASYSFVVWGLMYFICLIIEKYVIRPEERRNLLFKGIWHIITFFIIMLGWVLFDTESISLSIQCYASMIGYYGNAFIDVAACAYLQEYAVYIFLGVLFAFPVAPMFGKLCYRRIWCGRIMDFVIPIGYMIVFLWAVSFLILGAHNPFIYFNF
ncbi:MAG: MBOAT family protein [Blautia sp.]|nr:MBOAT family protein [Blautia sp.]